MLIAKGATVFEQRFHRADGERIGTRTIAPWLGGARNGPLHLGRDDVARIELGGRSYRLEYEVLHAGGLGGTDTRCFLMDDDTTLATAAAFHDENRRRWHVDIDGRRHELVRHSTWRRLHFVLCRDGSRVGEVRETTRLLRITRTYEVRTVPALGPVIEAFLYHLAMVRTFR